MKGDKTAKHAVGFGEDVTNDPMKRISELVRDNVFLAIQVNNLERRFKKQ